MRVGKLAKHHRHKLAPTREPSTVALRVPLLHHRRKLRSRNHVKKLAKDAAYLIQGGTPFRFLAFLLGIAINVTGLPPHSQNLIWTSVAGRPTPLGGYLISALRDSIA